MGLGEEHRCVVEQELPLLISSVWIEGHLPWALRREPCLEGRGVIRRPLGGPQLAASVVLGGTQNQASGIHVHSAQRALQVSRVG